MILSSSKPRCLLAFLFVGASASSSEQSRSLLQAQQEFLSGAVANVVNQQRDLQWTIDFTPDSDPNFVCTEYQKRHIGTWECSCDIEPDKSIGLKCLELNRTANCNADSSLCFLQTVNLALTPQENKIIELETCAEYIDLNLTRFEGSSTKLANYSQIVPCVKVEPIAPGDFSSLTGCSASINGQACQKCEICDDKAPAVGITLDCCNTNPNGEQLKVACGPVGGGGAFVPIFDTYEEGDMETCSGAFGVFHIIQFVGLLLVGAALATTTF